MWRLLFFHRRIWICFIVFITYANVANAQRDTIISRYKKYLFQLRLPAHINTWYSSYDAIRQWPDIDYTDVQPANWQSLRHLHRTKDLAIAWASPRSPYHHNASYWKVINAALGYWLQKRPHNSNWWHNQIGVPQHMRDIITLLGDKLSAEQLQQSLQVLNQYRLQNSGAGANLTWSADLGLHYGALTGNDTLINRCATLMVNEIQVTTGDGIQPDYSFRQHGARLQMYQYGRAFLYDNVRIAWQLRGTTWAFPQEKVKLLVDCLVNGWQWMARGIYTVPGTMDRSVSRAGELRNTDLRPLVPYLCELYPDGTKDFLAIAKSQDGKQPPLQGFRYFPYVDFAAYQMPAFSFFLKTISDRTLATESINNENLKGKLLNSGDAYIVRNGREYLDLMPCWDWNLLPGITTFKGAESVSRRAFTGSVSDGNAGLSAMDYCMQGKSGQNITAKKTWACYNGVVLCLIAGLTKSNIDEDVLTVLDQCRWQGNVTVDTRKSILPAGDHAVANVKWIHHNGIAYLFPEPTGINLRLNTVTGTWTSINASGSSKPVTEKIFMPVIRHQFSEGTSSVAYVLAACETVAQVKALSQKPKWKILRNDTSCQAVSFADGTVMASFFTAGSLAINKNKLTTDRPCLLVIKKDSLHISDPSQAGGQVTIGLNGNTYKLQLPGHGFTTGSKIKQ
jgi:chondroitin AC lyase